MINLRKRAYHYLIVAIRGIKGYKNINGWLSKYEAIGLNSIARKQPDNAIVVEIGSWQGKSTFCIAKGLKNAKVYAIDPFNADGGLDDYSTNDYQAKKAGKDLMDVFLGNMRNGGVLQNIIVKRGYSGEFANDFDHIDFLFIDGDHSIQGCKNDYELYAHKVVKGGYIAFHDYKESNPEAGPTYVVHEFVNKTSDFRFYKLYDSLWVGRRN